MFAVEGLFGRAQVRLDARYELSQSHHHFTVDTGTSVGTHLVRVFTSLLQREFGDESFRVRRLPKTSHQPLQRTVPRMTLLKSIVSGRQPLPPRLLLYGTEGIGKSTFGAQAPAPIFIQTEDGLSEISCDKFPAKAKR